MQCAMEKNGHQIWRSSDIRVAQKTTFFYLHSISCFFPLYWVTWCPTKKIRSLAQFFRSAQLTWIFWLFDALLLYENCQEMHQNPRFWENCLFGVKKCILPQNKSCSKNLDFGACFGNFHIIKVHQIVKIFNSIAQI